MPYRTEFISPRFDKSNKRRYSKNIRYPKIPLSSNDLYVTTTVGDRLDMLAHQFYKDKDLWWVISTANPDIIRRDSFYIKSGIEIRIPIDTQSILTEFEKINES